MKAAGKLIAGFLALPVLLAFGYLYAQRTPDKPRFYVDDDLEWDVWRIPIIEPYNLITTDGNSGQRVGESRWHFNAPAFTNSFNPDSINYQQGFVTFYDASQHSYGFCDLAYKNVSFCGDYQEFREFTTNMIFSKELYNTEQVYEGWTQTRLLPWAKEILEERWKLIDKK